MENYSSKKFGSNNKFYITIYFILSCVISIILIVQTATAQEYTGTEDFEAIHAEFDAKHDWADKETQELFDFLYYNIPYGHRQKALNAYESFFTKEKNAISRQKVIDVTNAIMPDKAHGEIKTKINAAILKVTRYQDREKSGK